MQRLNFNSIPGAEHVAEAVWANEAVEISVKAISKEKNFFMVKGIFGVMS